MATVTESVEVDAGAEAVWAAAVDWPAQRHWVLGSRVRPGRDGGAGVGATVVALTGTGPLTITDPMEIVAWDPPRSVTLRHTGPLVGGTATYTVQPIGAARSRFTWSEELSAPRAALGPVYALGVPAFAVLVRLSLRRFARWAPTHRPTPGE